VKHQIYFLQRADGLIKIGTTTDFRSRLTVLTKSHGMLAVLRIVNGGRKREGALHRRFKRFHEYGEWFRSEHGALEALIEGLEEGDELLVGQSDAQTEWQAGEAEVMRDAQAKIAVMIKARMDRTMEDRSTAMAALTAEYGFSPWFLWHARKKGSSITAYAYQRVREAYVTELRELLAQLNREIAAGNLVDPAELEQILAEVKAKKARLK
jgi:hypothetical protein